jgi:uncharacterized membrane-anchored protein
VATHNNKAVINKVVEGDSAIAVQETGTVQAVQHTILLRVILASSAVLQRVTVTREEAETTVVVVVVVSIIVVLVTGVALLARPTILLPRRNASSAATQSLKTFLRMEASLVVSITVVLVTGIAPVVPTTSHRALLASSAAIPRGNKDLILLPFLLSKELHMEEDSKTWKIYILNDVEIAR